MKLLNIEFSQKKLTIWLFVFRFNFFLIFNTCVSIVRGEISRILAISLADLPILKRLKHFISRDVKRLSLYNLIFEDNFLLIIFSHLLGLMKAPTEIYYHQQEKKCLRRDEKPTLKIPSIMQGKFP
jgi:hypothetical protein